MSWKFWQIGRANEQIEGLRKNIEALLPSAPTPVRLFDPTWPEKRRAFLERLGNTPEGDATLAGVLALIEQEVLVQVQKCEKPGLTDAEAHSLCGRIGVLVGMRADLEQKWKSERAKRATAGMRGSS